MLKDYAINNYLDDNGKSTIVIEQGCNVFVLNIDNIHDIFMDTPMNGDMELTFKFNRNQFDMKIFEKENLPIFSDRLESTKELEEFLSLFQRSDLNV